MKSFEAAVDRLSRLPGIGKKSARRIVFHLLSIADDQVEELTDAIITAKSQLGYCKQCYGLSETELCKICSNSQRNPDQLCVVASPETILKIENTGKFNGRYHVLRGLISPLDGIGPQQLTISQLINRLTTPNETIQEVIFAFNPTNEGEVTINYLRQRLRDYPIKLSQLGYGLPVGSDLEYTDRMTLNKAFENRIKLNPEAENS